MLDTVNERPSPSKRVHTPQPAGYDAPEQFQYPSGVLFVLPVPLALLAALIFGGLFVIVQDEILHWLFIEPVLAGVGPIPGALITLVVPFGIALFVTAVTHEFLHAIAFRLYGYDVTYGVAPGVGGIYTVALDQFQRCEELVVIALAPAIVITLVCLPLLAATPLVALTALFVLLLNTSGAAGDWYLAWRCLRLPRGTLIYDSSVGQSYIYEPSNSSSHRKMPSR